METLELLDIISVSKPCQDFIDSIGWIDISGLTMFRANGQDVYLCECIDVFC